MDVQVDINELQQQVTLIDKTVSQLQNVCDTIRAKHRKSSAELEGNQFEIATEHINQTCQKVEQSISRLAELKKYLCELRDILEQYIKCRYKGE